MPAPDASRWRASEDRGAVATAVRPGPATGDGATLTRRVPQAQLNPLLPERPFARQATPVPSLIEMRERAEMRSALSSFQRQQRAGRDAGKVEEDRR
jgi:hypothetical protein